MVVLFYGILFCLFVATLSDFGLPFFLIEALIELKKEKDAFKEKNIPNTTSCTVWELSNP